LFIFCYFGDHVISHARESERELVKKMQVFDANSIIQKLQFLAISNDNNHNNNDIHEKHEINDNIKRARQKEMEVCKLDADSSTCSRIYNPRNSPFCDAEF